MQLLVRHLLVRHLLGPRYDGQMIGEVLAATERAACDRAVHKFKIAREDRRELEVRRSTDR